MKVVIVGSGLMGVTSAYFLRRHGHEVTVLDRADGAGLETSFANGALLTPSMAEPWNAPGSWRALLASIYRADAPMKLHATQLIPLAPWGIAFFRNSRSSLFHANTLSNLRLALYSLEMLRLLEREAGIEYWHNSKGSLRVFREAAALERAASESSLRIGEFLSLRMLSTREAIELEPALTPIAHQLQGAIHYPSDEVGDAYEFCVSVAERARQLGVVFHWQKNVSALELRSGRLAAVLCGHERFEADRYVMAAGSYSALLLRQIAVSVPIQPAKGYSVTLTDNKERPSLRIPVIDDHLHAAVVPLAGTIRVAGTAEFAGYDRSRSDRRIQNLLTLLASILPGATLDMASAQPWCGLRPMSADGVPLIGPTRVENLILNTGHGHLGWTMAAGSGRLLADIVSGNPTKIDRKPYDPKRFRALA